MRGGKKWHLNILRIFFTVVQSLLRNSVASYYEKKQHSEKAK